VTLALLQTVTTFKPAPSLSTGGGPGPPDADACETDTVRRKVNEEVMEADFPDRGTGRVTGKGWWSGVEAGERGGWDLSLLIPVRFPRRGDREAEAVSDRNRLGC